MKLRAGATYLLFAAATLYSGRADAAESPANASAALDPIRRFLVGLPAAEAAPTTATLAGDELWSRYLALAALPPAQREPELRKLLGEGPSESLRRVLLRDLVTDTAHQSRQAKFIRRYGFYANWFNRAAYTTSRALQGNLQAFFQIPIDAVFEAFGRGEATPAERRLAKLLRDLDREGRAGRQDAKRLAELEGKVARAQAGVDLERARWAMKQGDPETAEFYARGALGLRPGWGKAEKLRGDAEREIARRARAAAASAQVGYPDRTPSVEMSSASLLRAVLSDKRSELVKLIELRAGAAAPPASAVPAPAGDSANQFLDEGDVFLATVMTTLSDQDDGGIMAMRRWVEAMNEIHSAKLGETAWLRALLESPQFNPDLRLARAQATRQASLARFIFLGPDSAREQAYKLTSRSAQVWNAISSLGIFYGFEVAWRAGVAAFGPPPPAEEMFDAQAGFLRAAPLHPDAREVAGALAKQYRRGGRYDQAREVLARYGQLDVATNEDLMRGEARRLLTEAEAMAPGDPRRAAKLARVKELAPLTGLAARAERMADAPEMVDEIELAIDWDALYGWAGALPAGLPGDAAWFDGDAANGEFDGDGVTLRAAGPRADRVTINYPILRDGSFEIFEGELALASAPERLRALVKFELAEAARAAKDAPSLGRPAIPYEFTGGAGASGVDFYPRLLPIELGPGEMDLYRDAAP